MMLRLVTLRSIGPNVTGTLEVASSHDDDLAGSHPGQPLELDHGPYLSADERLHRHHQVFRHWFHRRLLSSPGAALTKPRNGTERFVDGGGNELLGDPPLEHADDPADTSI